MKKAILQISLLAILLSLSCCSKDDEPQVDCISAYEDFQNEITAVGSNLIAAQSILDRYKRNYPSCFEQVPDFN